jgi:pimeloyl-ACP methyl ester carboxylesterase
MYARSRGWRIRYVVEGSGPALVLVPGLMASASSWTDAGYVLRFSDEFQVIAVDPLGHGKSDSPTEGEAYLVDQCALDILAVLDAEGVEAAHVWGYSRGGLLASVLATEHPRRMRSLVVGGSGFLTMPPPLVSAFSQPLRRKAEALRVGDWNEYWTLMGLMDLDGPQRSGRPRSVAVWARLPCSRSDTRGPNREGASD